MSYQTVVAGVPPRKQTDPPRPVPPAEIPDDVDVEADDPDADPDEDGDDRN